MPSAYRQYDCVKVCAKRCKGYVVADANAVFDLDAQVSDQFQFVVDDCFGQTVFGNAVTQHSAAVLHCLENGDFVTFQSQIIGSGYSCGTCAYDRDFFAGRGGYGRGIDVIGRQIFVSRIVFELSDGNGLFDVRSAAGFFTGVRTNSAYGRGHGDALFHYRNSLFVVAQSDLFDVSLTIGAGGTVQRTRSATIAFVVAHQQFERDFSGAIYSV